MNNKTNVQALAHESQTEISQEATRVLPAAPLFAFYFGGLLDRLRKFNDYMCAPVGHGSIGISEAIAFMIAGWVVTSAVEELYHMIF